MKLLVLILNKVELLDELLEALCNHVVFKKPVTAVKYMPIDILMKENIDFYFEFE